ncbi:MAG: 6-pyruvoyl tetrahydropterin synthase [Nitrospiraceae bacterium]|nr:6-pyruvoyl tetrahydropterin synthase [Nitrospiraceae bacterium]|tara:strand:+ start:186 stop:1046 length:861 start_codon:yes stop_codon:yes gene_type:complete
MSNVFLTKRVEFCASHRYYQPHWSDEQNLITFGHAYKLHGHGHNYLLEVSVGGPVNAVTGMVLNMYDLKHILEIVLSEFDHKDLDRDTPYFTTTIATPENLALVLSKRIASHLQWAYLERVRLFEDEDLYVDYPNNNGRQMNTVFLTRRYHFSAAHRLHTDRLSPEKNKEIFGKCNNPNGHGHNYTIEITICGQPHQDTGTIYNLPHLDQVVNDTIVKRFDHQHINYDPAFRDTTTTGENLLVLMWDLLSKEIPVETLYKVGLIETRDNYFEYYGQIPTQSATSAS